MKIDSVLNDRLAASYAHIREIVESTVNFQGRLEHVVVDELQFTLNLCSVAVWRDGRILASNLTASEAEYLDAHFEKLSNKETKFGEIRVLKAEGPSVEGGPDTMRAPARAATCRYSARSLSGRIDLYYRPDYLIEDTSKYLDLQSPHGTRLLGFVAESLKLIAERAQTKASADDPLRLLSQIESSQYLKILLGKLKSGILEHLRQRNPVFATRSEFLIQFFFRYYDKGGHKILRYFPLDDEIAQLSDYQNVDGVIRRLSEQGDELPKGMMPREFILGYDWGIANSFVGYVLDTGCALYLGDWKDEPLVKRPAVIGELQRRNRRIATAVMQHFRKDTPDQFIVPFFYQRTAIGLMLVNCPEPIPPAARLLLIRSARSVAPQIYMAIDSDKEVNHVAEAKRKASEVRAYKYIVNAIMHEEARFCRKILEHLATQPIDAIDVVQLLFMASEKEQAVEEYQGSDSPIRCVNDAFVYPDIKSDVPVVVLEEFKTLIAQIYDENQVSHIMLEIGPNLRSRGSIPKFEKYIIARVMINLIKNSLNAARKKSIPKGGAVIGLFIELTTDDNASFLNIVARDNCGGFKQEQVRAWGELTVDKYIEYLTRKQEEQDEHFQADVRVSSGMGLLIIAKYVNSTRGTCRLQNIKDPISGEPGAEVVVRLKLQDSLHE